MGAHHAQLPSRYHNPLVVAENPAQIAEATDIYSGHFTYNAFAGRDMLPAINGAIYMGGGPAYPIFTHDVPGQIFVIENRFGGSEHKLPRLSVGTVAMLEDCTVVNVPLGSNYPKSYYEERIVHDRSSLKSSIGAAVFDLISGNPKEVDATFHELNLQRLRKYGQARRAMDEVMKHRR